jgi:hypothetical protein
MSESTEPPESPDPKVISLNYKLVVEAIGKVCVEFQTLEADFKSAVGELLDPLDARLGVIITAQLSFKGILDLFEALFDHRFNDPVLQEKLRKFLGQCKAAEDRRNQIIHSHWIPENARSEGVFRVKFSARGALKATAELLSQTDLQEVANNFNALGRTLYRDWFPEVRKRGYQLRRARRRNKEQ